MNPRNAGVFAAIVLLTLLTYFQFPGHTYLTGDSQIYVPILEHEWNPVVLARDLIATHSHLAFTAYDEIAIGLRKLTGSGFREALISQQFVGRALGLLGVYLVAVGLKLSPRMSLLVAAIFALGATVEGPSVLTEEYEPVPRSIATPLLLLAVGLVAHARYLLAGAAVGVAFLYHPPVTYPFLLILSMLAFLPAEDCRRRWASFAPIIAAVLLLGILARLQASTGEAQPLFGRLDAAQEQLQRMRAPYNFVSTWGAARILHFILLWIAAGVAFLRIRKFAAPALQLFLIGLPWIGMVSIPVSYLLLEKFRWALIPQFQPARALVFLVAIASIVAAVAAIYAAQTKRHLEAVFWFALAFALPTNVNMIRIFIPHLRDPVYQERTLILLALSVAAGLAAWMEIKSQRWAAVLCVSAGLLPFLLLPGVSQLDANRDLNTPPLAELSEWARRDTSEQAMFLFPDAGTSAYPGIFRANSLRAVYVEWKGGGQLNFFKQLGDEWWSRWQKTMAPAAGLHPPAYYASLGVNYVVFHSPYPSFADKPVFQDAGFQVYRVSGSR